MYIIDVSLQEVGRTPEGKHEEPGARPVWNYESFIISIGKTGRRQVGRQEDYPTPTQLTKLHMEGSLKS